MTLNTRNWLVRYAYFIDKGDDIPSHTTLCDFFWRVVLTSLVWAILAIVLGLFLKLVWDRPQETAAFVGLVASSTAATASAIWVFSTGFMRATIAAFKERYCPIIRIVDNS